jgi:hypothetical protein
VVELPTTNEPESKPAPAALIAGQNGNGMNPPVRLFDRRKTREASRLNGYRRPIVVNGNGDGSTLTGAALVDRFGRKLDNADEVAVNGNGHHDEPAPVRVAAASEETGD